MPVRESIVLIAPNDPEGRELADWLTEDGFDVVVCPDGGQALTQLHRISRPSVIVAVLPVMGLGLEAFRAIQRHLPGFHDLPFLLVVAPEADRSSVELLDPTASLVRPFDRVALSAAVHRLVAVSA